MKKITEKFLEGKVALITGAGGGFGTKMALNFAKLGADLVLNDIDEESLKETKQKVLDKYNSDVMLAVADITQLDQVEEMKEKVFEHFDNVFLLVNNAGIDGGLYTSLKSKEKLFDNVMGVNVKGSWNMTKTFFRKMKRQKHFEPIRAKIINIASTSGTHAGLNPFIGVYSASKATVIAFTKLWALELGPNDITCNAISPGVFLTPIYNNDPSLIRKFLDMRNVKIPIDRIGRSEEVADMAVFLASPKADYINGHNLVIDGGMTTSINKM